MPIPLAWHRKTGLNGRYVLPAASPMSRSLILRSLWLPSLILGIGVVLWAVTAVTDPVAWASGRAREDMPPRENGLCSHALGGATL